MSRIEFISSFMNQPDLYDPSIFLRAAGLQVTPQRLSVYKAVRQHPHVMADEVCQQVREEIGTISRQAVMTRCI